MPKGTIKRLTTDRGFGFIQRAEGEDLFFHSIELRGVDFGCLREGQEVEFEVKQRFSGRPQAIKVRLAQPQGEQHKAWAGRFGEGVMFYFAYGSNLSHKQMLQRCPGEARIQSDPPQLQADICWMVKRVAWWSCQYQAVCRQQSHWGGIRNPGKGLEVAGQI